MKRGKIGILILALAMVFAYASLAIANPCVQLQAECKNAGDMVVVSGQITSCPGASCLYFDQQVTAEDSILGNITPELKLCNTATPSTTLDGCNQAHPTGGCLEFTYAYDPATSPSINVISTWGTLGTQTSAVVTESLTCNQKVDVEKFCSVPPTPPSTSYTCVKPYTDITLIWRGSDSIYLVRENDGSTIPGIIAPGDTIVLLTPAAFGNNLYYTLHRASNDFVYGRSTFHVSCSDPDMRDPGDCGSMQGDGKGLTGYVNEWELAGFNTAGGRVTCTPPQPPVILETCEVSKPSCGSCANGHPTALIFEYNPNGTCASTTNWQNGKFKCQDGALGALQSLVMTKDASKFNVSISGNLITISMKAGSSSTFPSQIYYKITGANGTHSYSLHTSCSQRLVAGDVFGPLTLKCFVPKGSKVQPNVRYTYIITNHTSAVVTVDVFDDKLGQIADNLIIAANGNQMIEKDVVLNSTTINVVTVKDQSGNVLGSDQVTVTVLP